jgi:hypothetical protein
MEGASRTGPRWALALGWSVLAAAALASACTPYIGTTASSYLRRVKTDPDPNIRYLAYAKLSQPGCYDSIDQQKEAVKILLTKLDQGKEPVASRAVIISTIGELGDRSARDVMVRMASDPEPVLRVQACRALGKVGKPEDATVLARVMTVDTLEDCRIAAIEAIGELKPTDPRITQMLIAGMRHEDPATRLASLKALRRVTGKNLSTDALAWQKAFPADGDAVQAASAKPSPDEATAPPAKPVYPPWPVAPRSIAAAEADLKPRPGSKPTAAPVVDTGRPSGTGQGSYPTSNPNLPSSPATP